MEYAAVNYFMYKTSAHSKLMGRNIDNFFKYTAGPLWILVVALYFLRHQGTQIALYTLASIWACSGSSIFIKGVYAAFKDTPTCLRLRRMTTEVFAKFLRREYFMICVALDLFVNLYYVVGS